MERYDIRVNIWGDVSGPQYEWETVRAEEGDFVLYADAQATIAALQAQHKLARDAWWESVKELEAQLTQRTAELERVRGELVEATHNADVYQSLYSTGCMDRALLENDLRELRTLTMAYAEAKTDFDDKRLQEDHHAWRERYTRLVGAETILIALTATSQEVL